MLPLVVEGTIAIEALESVRAEVIPLRLDQIRAQSRRAEGVNILESVDERGDRNVAFARPSDRPTHARQPVEHFRHEEIVEHEIFERGIFLSVAIKIATRDGRSRRDQFA